MEYFKHKTLSIYIWSAIFIWPFLHNTISPSNNAILTFIIMMADLVVSLNKNRKMIYAEYKLIKGKDADTLKVHAWLIFIISSKIMQVVCSWAALICLHHYSPIYDFDRRNRVIYFYIALISDTIGHGIYHRCYKKWIITYSPVSTNDTELATLA